MADHNEITELSTIPKGLESDKATERKVYRTKKKKPFQIMHITCCSTESGF